MVAKGLRSSWLASATNCRCTLWAPCSRASSAFIVAASRPISSRVAGTGTRWLRSRSDMAATRARIASTGRSASPVAAKVASAVTNTSAGTPSQSRCSAVLTLLSTPFRGTAASTVRGPSGVMIPRTATISVSSGSIAGETISSVTTPPGTGRALLSGICPTSGALAATIAPLASRTCTRSSAERSSRTASAGPSGASRAATCSVCSNAVASAAERSERSSSTTWATPPVTRARATTAAAVAAARARTPARRVTKRRSRETIPLTLRCNPGEGTNSGDAQESWQRATR